MNLAANCKPSSHDAQRKAGIQAIDSQSIESNNVTKYQHSLLPRLGKPSVRETEEQSGT